MPLVKLLLKKFASGSYMCQFSLPPSDRWSSGSRGVGEVFEISSRLFLTVRKEMNDSAMTDRLHAGGWSYLPQQ